MSVETSPVVESTPEAQHARLTEIILGAALEVHRALGPGLLESAYEACLVWELEAQGLAVARQVAVPVLYKGVRLELGYRVDLLVENAVIVELKAVKALEPIHTAQLLTYLRLSGVRVGLLLNFNAELLKHGIKRVSL